MHHTIVAQYLIPMAVLPEHEAAVKGNVLREEYKIKNTDAYHLVKHPVLMPLRQLSRIGTGPVVEAPLLEVPLATDLHLHVVNVPFAVLRPGINYRYLVIQIALCVEGVHHLQFFDRWVAGIK